MHILHNANTYILCWTNEENLFNIQDLLKLHIVFFILMTFTFDWASSVAVIHTVSHLIGRRKQ